MQEIAEHHAVVRARIQARLRHEDVTEAVDDALEALKVLCLEAAMMEVTVLLLDKNREEEPGTEPDTGAVRDQASHISTKLDEAQDALSWLDRVMAAMPAGWHTAGKSAHPAIILDDDLKAGTDHALAALKRTKELADLIVEDDSDEPPSLGTLRTAADYIGSAIRGVDQAVKRLEELLREHTP
jgi:uncharacterized protein YukE